MAKEKSRLLSQTASVLNRAYFIVYIILFFLIVLAGDFIVSLFGEMGDSRFFAVVVILRYLLMLLSVAVPVAVLTAVWRALQSDRRTRLDDRRFQTMIILLGVGTILIIQLICAFCFRMSPIKDIAEVEEYVFKIIPDNSYACIAEGWNDYYLVKYPNNLTYLFILTLIYRLAYAVTGTFSQVPVLIVNTLAINLSILLTVLTARRIFGGRQAIFTLILCAMFTPYYTYAAFYYTDSLSMPVLIGTVYLLTAALQSEKRKKKLALLLCSGLLCGFGFELKASIAILLPAAILYLLFEYGFLRMIKMILPVLLSFVIVLTSFSAVVKATDIIPEEVSDRYQYPVSHWPMMGLKDMGAYNPEDSDYTAGFPSKAEKFDGNMAEIKRRIEEKGFFGMIYHLGFKATWTWMDGTYYIGYYLINYYHRTPLHDFVLYDGRWRFIYYAAASGFQLFLILMPAYSGLGAARKKTVGLTTFLRFAVAGFFLFLLIWETNNRYPFHFSPLYLLLAAEGVGVFSEQRLLRLKKKKV